MIKNWDYHDLRMDFSSMYEGNRHPSDIDMIFLGKTTLVIGEIKNERGELKDGQRHLLEKLVKGWKGDAICIYIEHKKYWQKGDRVVNVAECEVKEIYYKSVGKWLLPKRRTKVKEIIDYYGG